MRLSLCNVLPFESCNLESSFSVCRYISEYVGHVHISRFLVRARGNRSNKRHVCMSCSWVVCRWLKGGLVYLLSVSLAFTICYDVCCRALSQKACFPNLLYLDMSGCFHLTGDALKSLCSVCPALKPSSLYYCDNIVDGPFPDDANSCRNLQCSLRACCRTGDWPDSLRECAVCLSWECWCLLLLYFTGFLPVWQQSFVFKQLG